jgi:hypothetical protein
MQTDLLFSLLSVCVPHTSRNVVHVCLTLLLRLINGLPLKDTHFHATSYHLQYEHSRSQ